MQLGLFVGALPTGRTTQEQVAMIVDAERRGFESIWFAQVGETDVLTTLALAGPETERIALGTAVIPTYTRHPSVLAQQASTVNQATGGRLHLGIGPSHQPIVERLGLEYDRPAVHIREYAEILRALTTEGVARHRGDYYRMASGYALAGASPFPILVSALAPLMLRVAGEVADGTITWMAGPTALSRHVTPRINAAAADAGRPAPRVVTGVPVAVTDDVEAGRAAAAETFEVYGQLTNYRRILDRGELGGPQDVAIVGNESQVAEHIAAYAEAGATDLIAAIYPVGDDASASIERTSELLASLVGDV